MNYELTECMLTSCVPHGRIMENRLVQLTLPSNLGVYEESDRVMTLISVGCWGSGGGGGAMEMCIGSMYTSKDG
jgi:hypothetical protein